MNCPMINDVATDVDDPPTFAKAAIGPLPEDFKPIIRDFYSDLKPTIFASVDKKTVFEAALNVAKEQERWWVTYEDAKNGVVEGYAVTKLLRFRDDFVIRVKERAEGGSVVDMRSRSRLGKGDLGVNAQRIRDYLQALSEALKPKAT